MERGEEGKVATGGTWREEERGVLRVIKRGDGYFPWKLSILFRPPQKPSLVK